MSAFKEKHNDLTMDTVDDLYGEFLPSLTITARQQHAIEYRTRGQSKVPLWQEMRYGRLTASEFGNIAKQMTAAEPLAKRLLQEPKDLQVPAILWG